MSDESPDGGTLNSRLNELIRQAVDTENNGFTMPTDEAIGAYIGGTATDEQEQEILNAIESSPVFARMLLDMLRDYDDWSEADGQDRSRTSIQDKTTALGRLRSSAWYIKLAPLAVAAVLILTVLFVGRGPRSDWTVADARLSQTDLTIVTPRSGSPQMADSLSVQEAALAALSQAFEVNDDGKLVVVPDQVEGVVSPGAVYTITLETGRFTTTVQSVISGFQSTDLTTPQLWVVAMPAQSLRRLDDIDLNQTVAWQRDWGTAGVLVVTATTESGTVVGSVGVFDFQAE